MLGARICKIDSLVSTVHSHGGLAGHLWTVE